MSGEHQPGQADTSVDDFLRTISQLGEKREKEDQERTRKLEEEILQGRRERQARRAERARSIVSSPRGSPSATSSAHGEGSPTQTSPHRRSQPPSHRDSSSTSRGEMAATNHLDPVSPRNSLNSSAFPSRSATLSWQRRPTSQDANSPERRSGLGLSDTPTLTPSTSTGLQSTDEPSRTEIAQSLASKDPSWFRQTPDRGIRSAAYRKSQEQGDEATVNNNMRLPGMTQQLASTTPATEDEGGKKTRDSYARKSGDRTSQLTDAAVSAKSDITSSPPPLRRPQDLETRDISAASVSDPNNSRIAMSPAQGRLSPERPPSPTKGLGGFVQSAMLKRSDSVNKRWNVQTAPGLSRADSIASNRSSVSASRGPKSPQKESHTIEVAPTNNTAQGSRPSSSHSTSTVRAPSEPATLDFNAQPNRASQMTHLSLNAEQNNAQVSSVVQNPLPVIPTKTMDPKRWSPTKSSWLESALNKPESPKVMSPPMEQPPSWRTSLHRAREGKGSVQANNLSSASKESTNPRPVHSPPRGDQSPSASTNGLPHGLSNSAAPFGNVQSSVNGESMETSSRDIDAVNEKELAQSSDSNVELNVENKTKIAAADTRGRPGSKTDSFQKQTARSPEVGKKPETLRKPDFRANLKPRETTSDRGSSADTEFKKVFGSLKRTETKNYVAPDELKSNILRGKAGLNITGGPRKTARVDEFKESILKQKEAMKVGGGSINKEQTHRPTVTAGKPSPPIPEALQRKHQFERSASIRSDLSTSEMSNDDSGSVGPPPPNAMPPPSRASVKRAGSSNEDDTYAPPASKAQTVYEPVAIEPMVDKKAGTGSEPVSGSTASTSETVPPLQQSPSLTATTTPVQLKGDSKGGRLANRLNPALAGLISRGPLQPTLPTSKPGASEPDQSTPSSVTEPSAETKSGDALNHMTKARAKGPRRRLPNTATKTTNEPADLGSNQVGEDKPSGGLDARAPSLSPLLSTSEIDKSNSQDLKAISSKTNEREDQDKRRAPPPALALKHAKFGVDQGFLAAQKDLAQEKEKPPVSSKSPALREVSNASIPPASNALSLKAKIQSPVRLRDLQSTSSPVMPDRFESIDKGSTSSINASISTSVHHSDKPAGSIKFDPKGSSALARHDTSANSFDAQPFVLKASQEGNDVSKIRHAMSNSAEASPKRSKQSVKDSSRSLTASKPKSPKEIANSKEPSSTSTASVFLHHFFDSKPTTQMKATFDTDKVLSSQARHVQSQAQTIQVQVFQIDSSGKKIPMPPYKEHILFEDGIYLCIYTYHLPSKPNDRLSQVFLWVGDEVSEATLEDVQIFCRKVARESSAKLEILRQGKETPVFLQALNGVLIVRRSKADALYMLSTRMHMGYLAFDEVDFHTDNLCSGFPYLINAKYGKQLLWKGKGSSADELGIARLIGMDLGLTGEMEEIEEAAEPAGFFENFPQNQGSKGRSQVGTNNMRDLWVKKPRSAAYCARLYRLNAEAERPTSSGFFWPRRNSSPPKERSFVADIAEVSPFAQRDIEGGNIYILDAFFKIFVIATPQSQAKSIDFITAVLFAQEYAILATSTQDRPTVPVCTVLLPTEEGDGEMLPRDFTDTFRKWNPQKEIATSRWKSFAIEEVVEACETA